MNARMPGELADAAALVKERQRSDTPFTPYDRQRLNMATQLAAGMLGNPKLYEDKDWRRTVVTESMRISDKLLTMWITGGC